MSGSVHIVTRTTKYGERRYVVRWRLGGRYYKLQHGGSFKRERDAKERRNLIAGELAAGRDPRAAIQALRDKPQTLTLAKWGQRYVASRVDASESRRRNIRQALARVDATLGERDPHTLTTVDCQLWIADNDDLNPGTLKNYYNTLQLLLDFAGVDPNPARSSKVKLPRYVRAEHSVVTWQEIALMLERLPARYRLPVRLMECCALRVGELAALTWGDVDWAHGRIRVSRARTKGRTAGQRFLLVPDELLAGLGDLASPEGRESARRVFGGLTESGVQKAMVKACEQAGVVSFTPHDLRHRRSSLWGAQGTPQALWSRRMGHAQVSTTQDVYSHVIAPDDDTWADFWRTAAGKAE